MLSEIMIVDQFDRELERMLAGSAARRTSMAGAQMATLAHPSAPQPDLIVLDLRGGKRLPAGLRDVKDHHPDTPVVIVASSADPVLMLAAMRAGVNEFVVEPLAEADLEAAIARVTARRKSGPSVGGEVFAFVGAKGGVGASTAVINVATALSKLKGGRTLVVDLHLTHGDAAVLLGAEARFSVMDAIENTQRLDETFLKGLVAPTKAGPDLLPSSERALAGPAGSQEYRTVIETAARVYRYVVLDVPRSDAAALDGLDSAARIVVVANQELTAVRNASRIASALRQRYGKDKVHVVVNRFDKDAEITHQDLERVLGGAVRHFLPSDYRRALKALNAGRPLTVENHSTLAAAYVGLAHELAGIKPPEPEKHPEPGGLFSIFTNRK